MSYKTVSYIKPSSFHVGLLSFFTVSVLYLSFPTPNMTDELQTPTKKKKYKHTTILLN